MSEVPSAPGGRVEPEAGLVLSVVVPVYNERFLVAELLSRLLAVEVPGVSALDVVVVDDGSSDGSAEIVAEIAAASPERIRFLPQERNRGKGAAVRAGIEAARGDLIVIQDADLEYDPRDFAQMVRPFLEDGADVVYGSRFAASARRRVLYFRHTLGNRLITFLSNLATDLNLSDVETCYKMFRAPLLKSLPIRANDFRLEIELTAKAAKRGWTIYEVPVSYRGRTYREGKKIGWRDGVRALGAIVHWALVDDLYRDDAYGGGILHSLDRARRFNRWMGDTVRPWVGDRVLEVGAGIGNITSWLVPRQLYAAADLNHNYLHYLRNFAAGKPYLEVSWIDATDAASFAAHRGRYDTVICLNVLEHLEAPERAVENLASALEPGGRLVVYVPQGPRLFSSLDRVLEHRRRYDRATLTAHLEDAGLELESLADFNRFGVLGWWWNGKVLGRKRLGRWQLKLFDLMVPFLRRLDRVFPWRGLGLIAVARRPGGAAERSPRG